MRAYFITFGCKVNQYETQAMMQLLERDGYTVEEWTTSAQDGQDTVVVINSCTVTAESDRKLRQMLRKVRKYCPQATLVLTGCFSQVFPDKAQALEQADVVLGNVCRNRLPQVLREFKQHRERIVSVTEHTVNYEKLDVRRFEGRTRAFLKIEDGCNRFCSYCIIPYARGRVRSLAPADLLIQTRQLAEQGFQEIVLVGINLTAYGQDIGCNIADAVETVCSVPGIRRVRLGSLEPDHVTDEVLTRLAACKQLCPQFHVALQSGCDNTLKRMRRRYTAEQFASLCARLRYMFPRCTFTTDIMVGFPGETEEDFEQSMNFCEQIGFARMHVFAYSRRPGTPADRMPDQIVQQVKSERAQRMGACAQRLAEIAAQQLVGQTVEVLVETDPHDGYCEGYTDTYLPVRIPAAAAQPGKMQSVHIIKQDQGVCYAQ